MDIAAIEILSCRLLIRLSCKSSQSLVINIQPQRVSASKEYIYPQIKFQLIDQQWVFDVSLHNIFIAIDYIFNIAGKENTSTLWQGLGFDYIGSCFSFLTVLEIMPKLTKL